MPASFNAATLAGVVQELQPLLGAQVQRITQPHELRAVFSVYRAGLGEKHLLIDVSTRFYRAHLTRVREKNPTNPLAFCAAARKYLEGTRIIEITQRAGDRILDIRLQSNNGVYLLSAELMGKHANLILVGPDKKILHALKLISSKQSRLREILPGRDYEPPPTPASAAPTRSLIVTPESGQGLNEALDEYFSVEVPRAEREDERKSLRGQLSKALSQKQLALSQLEKGTRESGRAAQYRRWGELLLGSVHQVKQQLGIGTTEVSVPDYYSEDGAQAVIPVNHELSAADNAEHYFSRARHVEAHAEELLERATAVAGEVNELEGLLQEVETAQERDALRPLREKALAKGWLRDRGETAVPGAAPKIDFEGHRIKKFTSAEGYEVLVGENATANDFLVRHLSHSNDWWLHLRSGTSAHAIIRTRNAPDRVPLGTLLFAAKHVASRSIAKHAGLAEVDYTLRKYVRKPRKAAPGAVTYSNQKTLRIEQD